jgi:uroporphyrinogen-III synthase
MRVLVTRPLAQAAEWVEALRSNGIDAVALPLIAIVPPSDPLAVVDSWANLAGRRLVVFVSPNAALQFFARAPAVWAWPEHTRVASPGPGTTRTLIALGVPPRLIDAPADDAPQFDSETLWRSLQMRDWHGASVLLVRGPQGRDWLAARLAERGAVVDTLAAYERETPHLDATESALLDQALTAPRRFVWLFSSSEAIDHLQKLTSRRGDPGEAIWRASRALATHPRIAQRARDAGFAAVLESRPTPSAVVACIQSIRP